MSQQEANPDNNITNRKQCEETLQIQEERLRMALAASQQSWFDLNVQTGEVMVSPEYWRILGYEPEEFHASLQSWIDGLHPEDRDAVLKVFHETIDTGATKTMEYRRMAKDGSWTWIRSLGRVVEYDSNNKALRMIGTHTDITKWKQTEKMLREAVVTAQEEKTKSEAIVAAIGDGLVILDHGFKIVYQNKVMRKMLGNLVGKVCYQAGEGRDTICENCPVEQSFRDGLIHRAERARTTRDETVHLDITSSPLCDASEKVIGVIEVVRDVSEQRRAEKVLRRSHEELEILVNERTAELTMMNEQLRNLSVYLQNAREEERKMVARDIHDDLGQSLTAIKLGLAHLRKRLPEDQKPLTEQLDYVAKLVESSMQSVKRISAELRPGILDHIGLDSAIEWHAAEFEKRNYIPCTVVFEPENIYLDRDRSTAVYRIFQETLTNVARHANASKVEAFLKLQPDELLLRITDNGKGITEQQALDSKSIGLIGMRERAHYWGGSFTIQGTPNRGTTVVVRIPLDKTGEALR